MTEPRECEEINLGLQEVIISNLALFQTKLGDELGQFAFQPTCIVPKDRKRAHLELLVLHSPHASVYKRYSHFLG